MTPPLPWQPAAMLHHPFHEKILPDIQSEPVLVQLEAASFFSVTGCLGEEANPFQGALESGKVSPEPLLLQSKQTSFLRYSS